MLATIMFSALRIARRAIGRPLLVPVHVFRVQRRQFFGSALVRNHAPVPSGSPTPNPVESTEPRMSLTFTCTVVDCGTRSSHTFTRRSYERGVVLVQCPGCKNRHLIADHLGWFKESMQDGKLRTVEDILRARGERVTRGRLDAGGVVEYSETDAD